MAKWLIFIHIFLFSSLVHASAYDSYKLKPMSETSLQKLQGVAVEIGLYPLNNASTGGIELFGVNQIFANHDFSRLLAFKYNVTGDIVMNQWEETGEGRVYHYRANGKTNAIFIKGFSTKSAQTIIDKIKSISITRSNMNFSLIGQASAADCNIRDLPVQNFSVYEQVTDSMIFQSLMSCGSGIKSGAYDATIGTATSAWDGLRSFGGAVGEVFTDPKKKMGEFYDGVVKGAMVVKDIYLFTAKMITNPVEAADMLRGKYGEASEKVIAIFDQVKNLPTEVKIEMTCSIITGLGIDALIVYLTAGGGAAKLALTFERISKQATLLGKVFTAMKNLYEAGEKGLKLTKDKMSALTRKILNNEINDNDLEILSARLSSPDKGSQTSTLDGLACFL